MTDIVDELKRVSRCVFKDGWESADLHARAGIEIAMLRARVAKLQDLTAPQLHQHGGGVEEALKFYADPANWNDGHFVEDEPNSLTMVMSTIDNDQGKTARAALAQQPLSVREDDE